MTQGMEFREADQRIVHSSALSTLNLAVGSHIHIHARPFEVTALSAIVDDGGSVQLYYVKELQPKPHYQMDDELRNDEEMVRTKRLDSYPWAGS